MDSRLDLARQLLEMGQVEEARGMATRILNEADEHNDRALQGQALLTLALFDRVLGRFRRAVEAAQKAVHLFQLEGDIAGEASALSLVAHANKLPWGATRRRWKPRCSASSWATCCRRACCR